MATIAKSFGYSRRNATPDLPNTKVKSCKVCRKWFAAYAYEQTCDGCVKPRDLTKRAISRGSVQVHQTRQSRPKTAGQSHVNHGSIDLCRELAFEMAAKEVSADVVAQYGRQPTMTKHDAYCFTKRNVELGLQGQCELERYL